MAGHHLIILVLDMKTSFMSIKVMYYKIEKFSALLWIFFSLMFYLIKINDEPIINISYLLFSLLSSKRVFSVLPLWFLFLFLALII